MPQQVIEKKCAFCEGQEQVVYDVKPTGEMFQGYKVYGWTAWTMDVRHAECRKLMRSLSQQKLMQEAA